MFKNQAVMYLRLSKDDGVSRESNSIANQREIIKSYVKKSKLNLVGEYVDDGYSGASFERPQFKQMIEDAYNKKFNTVIVKDLSRFGRDYIGAGRYIQRIFPEMGIRFISISDNYDSETASSNDTHLILPIKNFINDSYCRDISNKVKSSQKIKREKGEYIGSFAPYGYKKSEANKNKLIADENVGDIIRNIFDMKLQGYSSQAIAKELNALGIDSPRVYKEKQGLNYRGGFKTIKGGNWSAKSINRIIENEVYIGTMQQGKSSRLNYKNKKQIQKDKIDWDIVENTHEGIVNKEVYYIANAMLKRDLYSKGSDRNDLFSGMLFCKDCQSPLIRRSVRSKNKVSIYYICSKYNKTGDCTRHSIKAEDLEDIITKLIKDYISFNENLYQVLKDVDFNVDIRDSQISILQREQEMTEALLSSLYADLEADIISGEEYKLFRKSYLERLTKIELNIKNRLTKQTFIKSSIKENKEWIIDIKKYKKISKPDRLSIVMLIDRILIGENKEIEILFNHAQELSFLEQLAKKNDNTNKQSMESEVCCG